MLHVRGCRCDGLSSVNILITPDKHQAVSRIKSEFQFTTNNTQLNKISTFFVIGSKKYKPLSSICLKCNIYGVKFVIKRDALVFQERTLSEAWEVKITILWKKFKKKQNLRDTWLVKLLISPWYTVETFGRCECTKTKKATRVHKVVQGR